MALWDRFRDWRLRRGIDPAGLAPAARRHFDLTAGLDHKAPLSEVGFVVLDAETTGLDPAEDGLVCLGGLRVAAGRIDLAERFFRLVDPGRAVSAESIKIHGITPAMCRREPPLAAILPELLDFIGDRVLVGHLLGFDLAFLNRAMRAAFGLPLLSPAVDTYALCRQLKLFKSPYAVGAGGEAECGLDNLARVHRLDSSLRHTALGDALLTAQVLVITLHRLAGHGVTRLDQLLKAGRAG